MTQQDYRHPIAPAPELVQQWFHEAQRNGDPDVVCWMQATAAKAAQWGADQELEACCEWLASLPNNWTSTALKRVSDLRAARRPKPSSLKEQALQALSEAVKMADDVPPEGICSDQADIIRRALQALLE